MKVNKSVLGWEIVPETSDEEARLEWLIESVQMHPDQTRSSGETSCSEHLDG